MATVSTKAFVRELTEDELKREEESKDGPKDGPKDAPPKDGLKDAPQKDGPKESKNESKNEGKGKHKSAKPPKQVAEVEGTEGAEEEEVVEDEKKEVAVKTDEKPMSEEDSFFNDIQKHIDEDKAKQNSLSLWQKYYTYVWLSVIVVFIVFVLIILVMLMRRT